MAIIRRSFFNTPKKKEPIKPISQMSDKEKTEAIYNCLLDFYENEAANIRNWITIREVRCGTGFKHQSKRSFDFMAISSLNGNAVVGYEVKASRADFLKDLKNTEKQKPLRCFANLFYYVAPAGLIQTEDLPPWAGLKELRFDEDKQEFYLSETQTPPYMANLPPTWGFVAECIRNRSEFSTKRLMLENERLSLEIIRLEEKLRDLEFENFLLKDKKKEAENAQL